ncbi:hypothetical protein [Kordia sp.]|uniref:hypothetical protein n=1 Tax=Kordia sp. TaxID=1965332 RepID=UPI003D2A0A57
MNNYTFPRLLLLLTVFSLFNSCGTDPEDELERKIKVDLRSNNDVDEEELKNIISYINEDKDKFPALINEQNEINTNELRHLIFNIANKRRGKENPTVFNPKKIAVEPLEKPHIQVFIENSASMDGYVKNATEFEAALSDLLVQIQYHYDNESFDVNFINTKVYPSKVKEVNQFMEALEPSKAPYKVGNRSVSKLNEVFQMILDSTSRKNISILVSDCIYSLSGGKDTQGALEFQKSLTKGVFLEKSKEFDLSTLILKMNSKFDGTYYDKDNKPVILLKETRPYYIWVFGSNEQIKFFLKTIQLKTLKGYDNSYLLSNVAQKKEPFFTVLKETNKIGDFTQIDRKSKTINAINEIEFEDGILQFSIAVDLQNLSVDEKYILQPENYQLTTGYNIKFIEEIHKNNIVKRDFLTIGKTTATHLLTIQTSNNYPIQNLTLQLSNDIPEWVKASNSSNDLDIKSQLDKTFGLNYLIKGVAEAYQTQNPKNTSHLEIKITIKK